VLCQAIPQPVLAQLGIGDQYESAKTTSTVGRNNRIERNDEEHHVMLSWFGGNKKLGTGHTCRFVGDKKNNNRNSRGQFDL